MLSCNAKCSDMKAWSSPSNYLIATNLFQPPAKAVVHYSLSRAVNRSVSRGCTWKDGWSEICGPFRAVSHPPRATHASSLHESVRDNGPVVNDPYPFSPHVTTGNTAHQVVRVRQLRCDTAAQHQSEDSCCRDDPKNGSEGGRLWSARHASGDKILSPPSPSSKTPWKRS